MMARSTLPPVAVALLACLLLLSLDASSAWARPARVVLEPITASVESPPRGLVTLTYRVTNPTEVAATLIPDLDLPEGWRAVVPPESLDLEAGIEKSGLLTLLVPADAEAGLYSVILAHREVSGLPVDAARFVVRVSSLNAVRAVLVEAPSHAVAGQAYEAHFSVLNAGNAPQQLVFEVGQNMKLPITVVPEGEMLPPGGAADVLVRARVPADLSRPALHVVTLSASGAGPPGVEASASASVELIPRTLPGEERYHTFPLRLELEQQASQEDGLAHGWSLRGSGRVREEDPGLLTVRLDDEDSTLSYRRSRFDVAAGWQRFDLSPLTDHGEMDHGASLRFGSGPWDLRLYHRTTPASRTGMRVAHRWTATGATVALQGLLQPESGDLVSLGMETPIGTSSDAKAEVGVKAGCDPSTAFRIETSWAFPPIGGTVAWQHTDAGYRGQSGMVERLSLMNSLRIGTNGYVTLGWEDLREAGAEEGTRDQQLTFSLTGRAGERVWGARWAQAMEAATGVERWERSLRAHLLYPVPSIGGPSLLHVAEWREAQETLLVDLRSTSTTYQASLLLHFPEGSLSPYLRLGSETVGGQTEARWRVGLRADRRLDASRSIAVLGEVDGAGTPVYRLWGLASARLGGGAEMTLQADGRWSPGDDSRFTLRLGCAFPLQVPVGLRSDLGEIFGRVVDEEGKGLPGMIVRVGDLAAITGSDGSFHFPAVPAGVALLELNPEQLGPERVSLPGTPQQVEVTAGGWTEQRFQVVRGARVEGRLQFGEVQEQGAKIGAVWGEGEAPPSELLQNVVVELANGETAMRRVLDGMGRFAFERVPPGAWSLTVLEETLRGPYQVDPARVELWLEPGACESVEVTVMPRARRIQFVQEGVVEAPAAP